MSAKEEEKKKGRPNEKKTLLLVHFCLRASSGSSGRPENESLKCTSHMRRLGNSISCVGARARDVRQKRSKTRNSSLNSNVRIKYLKKKRKTEPGRLFVYKSHLNCNVLFNRLKHLMSFVTISSLSLCVSPFAWIRL